MSTAHFFRLVRAGNLLIIGVAQALTWLCLGNGRWDISLTYLILGTICTAGTGYIFNDYMDVRTDQINRPEKVLIGTVFQRRQVLILHGTMSALAILFGWLISWKLALVNGIIILLLVKYASTWKKTFLVGNLMVSLFCGLAVWLVAWITNSQQSHHIIAYSLFAFLTTLNREIIKDIEDIKGDKLDGCRTIPIVWGVGKTRKALFILNSLVVVASLLYFYTLFLGIQNEWVRWSFASYASLTVIAPLFGMLFLLNRASLTKEFSLLSRLNKVIMVMGVASMLFFL